VVDARDALTKEHHRLPNDWTWRWLNEVLEIRGGAQPPASTFVSEPKLGFVRFVQIRDFDGDDYHTYIEDSPRWRHCNRDDVLIARYGASLGRILRGLEGAYNVALVKAIPLGGLERHFMYHLLRSDYFQAPLAALGARSAQEGFNKGDLSTISVPLPPAAEQRAISEVLDPLDEKIYLNRRTNETLEGIARAFFKSWFVDFDPVRANVEHGRSARAPSADLFPAGFEHSRENLLPRGWSRGRLGDVAENIRAGVQPRDIQGATPYIALEHIPRRSITLYDWSVADNVASNKSQFKRGEILFGKLRPYFHKVAVAPVDGVCSTDILVIGPKSQEWFSFSLLWASSDEIIAHADAVSTGTKMPRCNWHDLANFEIPIPPVGVARAFDGTVRPMVEQMLAAVQESRTLAALRDALLPKLLSGEVRLHGAEREVAKAL